jgi:hypothetical protein
LSSGELAIDRDLPRKGVACSDSCEASHLNMGNRNDTIYGRKLIWLKFVTIDRRDRSTSDGTEVGSFEFDDLVACSLGIE